MSILLASLSPASLLPMGLKILSCFHGYSGELFCMVQFQLVMVPDYWVFDSQEFTSNCWHVGRCSVSLCVSVSPLLLCVCVCVFWHPCTILSTWRPDNTFNISPHIPCCLGQDLLCIAMDARPAAWWTGVWSVTCLPSISPLKHWNDACTLLHPAFPEFCGCALRFASSCDKMLATELPL